MTVPNVENYRAANPFRAPVCVRFVPWRLQSATLSATGA